MSCGRSAPSESACGIRGTNARAAGVAILALSLAFTAMAGSAMLAHAASSRRAQHVRASGCTLNIHTGILDCLTEDFVQNDTVTPSGTRASTPTEPSPTPRAWVERRSLSRPNRSTSTSCAKMEVRMSRGVTRRSRLQRTELPAPKPSRSTLQTVNFTSTASPPPARLPGVAQRTHARSSLSDASEWMVTRRA
jgi:curli biogenesis system outer membrane secretion channel CsgG